MLSNIKNDALQRNSAPLYISRKRPKGSNILGVAQQRNDNSQGHFFVGLHPFNRPYKSYVVDRPLQYVQYRNAPVQNSRRFITPTLLLT